MIPLGKLARISALGLAIISVLCFLSSPAYANIVVRAAIVNPTETEKSVPFKAYLPKEVKPDDVVDVADLEISFDPQQGSYYVHKTFNLKPKESISLEIEIEDIWVVQDAELNSVKGEVEKLYESLKDTDYSERALFLRNSIETKLNLIISRQKTPNPIPSGHISDYRENLKLLDEIKLDLQAARQMLASAKPVSSIVVWKAILAIIGFLGLLSLGFFIVWQRHLKSVPPAVFVEGDEQAGADRGIVSEERKRAETEKKVEAKDIEDILRKESK